MKTTSTFTRLRGAVRGMTLVELIIALVISSVLAISVVGVSIFSQRATVAAVRHNQGSQDARNISNLIARDIRQAVGLDATFTTAGGTTFDYTNNDLILRVPSIDAGENIIDVTSAFDRIVYHQPPDNPDFLVRTIITGPGSFRQGGDTEIGRAFAEMGFENTFTIEPNALGAFVIHYQFQIEREWAGRNYQFPVSGSVKLRNKAHPATGGS